MTTHHNIVIVGGGAAGISVASRIVNQLSDADVAVIEPNDKHYYQPLWTLVGGGVYSKEKSERKEAEVMPKEATWIKDFVESFSPHQNRLTTRSGQTVTYDYLVVAPGIQLNWGEIKGLRDSIGRDGVCSNYSFDTVTSTWDFIRGMQEGTAVFTHPSGAVKCGGAPQKIAYLADDHFRRAGVRPKVDVIFTTATENLFAVDKYRVALEEIARRKNVDVRYQHELVEVRAASKEAIYRHSESGEEVVISYDLLHVTPPMSAPGFVADSALAASDGWVDVNKHTLQHARFPNVFSLGDASNLPTSKTAAAIRKQAPVLVSNLLAVKNDLPMKASYNGYTSCPLVTGYNRLILAEFDYDKQPAETFPFDQSRERYSMFMLKKHGLPLLYWHGMLKGRA